MVKAGTKWLLKGISEMFFIFGISDKQEKLPYENYCVNICTACNAYCSYEVIADYLCLYLFFIPVLKFGKRYLVRTTCCGALFSISKEKGRAIEKGETVYLDDEDLTVP